MDTSHPLSPATTGSTATGNLGKGKALFAVTLTPEGQMFAVPVELTFPWLDVDIDGVMEGTNIREKAVTITKNNARLPKPGGGDVGRCSQESGSTT